MRKFKHAFEKHPNKKGQCPVCKRPGVFRYYVDQDRMYGKCERVNSCGYHKKPQSNSSSEHFLSSPTITQTSRPSIELVNDYLTGNMTNFHQHCLALRIPIGHLRKWGVGADGEKTAFIHYNRNNSPINVKFIAYDPSGHRIKKINPHYLKNPANGKYGQCLYGLHLLDEKKVICLVESEKTAVIASHFYPEFCWLATGGSNGLTDDKLQPIRNFKLIYIGDADKAGKNNSSLAKLKSWCPDLLIADLFPERMDGYDLADAISEGPLPEIPAHHSIEPNEIELHEILDSNGKIHHTHFLSYLEKVCGFHTYRTNGKLGEVQFVRVHNRIVELSDSVAIKHTFKEKCEDNSELLEICLRAAHHYFGHSTLTSLTELKGDFLKDTPKSAYITYANGTIEVSADKVIWTPPTHNRLIWKSDIISHELTLIESRDVLESFEFSKFLANIAGDQERLLSLQSAIGYMLHDWHAENRAVILTDSNLSKEPEGRTGKSLLCKAIGKIRSIVEIDGKVDNAENRFRYQNVNRSTKIICFNDVGQKRKTFDLEQLFTAITEGVQVEKKNMIPFQHRAKIIISSNRSVKVDGGSARARAFEFELSNHYSSEYSPRDEFGRSFFTDWSRDDWNKFHNVMISCIQIYLKNGLIKADPINLAERKLMDATTGDSTFLDFVNENIEIGKRYNKRDVFNQYQGDNPETQAPSLQTFTTWLIKYAEYKRCKIDSSRSNKTHYFTLVRN